MYIKNTLWFLKFHSFILVDHFIKQYSLLLKKKKNQTYRLSPVEVKQHCFSSFYFFERQNTFLISLF